MEQRAGEGNEAHPEAAGTDPQPFGALLALAQVLAERVIDLHGRVAGLEAANAALATRVAKLAADQAAGWPETTEVERQEKWLEALDKRMRQKIALWDREFGRRLNDAIRQGRLQ